MQDLIPLRRPKVMILLWQVPHEIELGGSPEPTNPTLHTRIEGNLPIYFQGGPARDYNSNRMDLPELRRA